MKPTKAEHNRKMLNEQSGGDCPNDNVVMCTTEDAFGFFAASLIDCYEFYFPGGENEIAKMSVNFQKAFEARLDKQGKYT